MSPMHALFDLTKDDLGGLKGPGANVVTLGEVMVRSMPADNERLERTRQVWVSLAGTEFSLACMLSRLGMSTAYITRLPDNPYGWLVRNVAREQGIDTEHLVWCGPAEPIGLLLYELGRPPRPSTVWYQRKGSAASRLAAGMVDWRRALQSARLLHTTGITFGLSTHSGYDRNYLLDAFEEALAHKPPQCLVGLDYNYRDTLWSPVQCRDVLTPIITDHVDVLIAGMATIAKVHGIGCGRLSAEELARGVIDPLEDEELRVFLRQLIDMFHLKICAVTLRYTEALEQHGWESATMDAEGRFFRSTMVRPFTVVDRLGGGDAWNAGFYYGLLTEADPGKALQKGVMVADAASRLKQTLMYDLPIISRQDVQTILETDAVGAGKGVVR